MKRKLEIFEKKNDEKINPGNKNNDGKEFMPEVIDDDEICRTSKKGNKQQINNQNGRFLLLLLSAYEMMTKNKTEKQKSFQIHSI